MSAIGDERWRGQVDERLRQNAEAVRALDLGVHGRDGLAKEMTEVKVELATLKTKVAAWSALGGVIGAGLVTLLVKLIPS